MGGDNHYLPAASNASEVPDTNSPDRRAPVHLNIAGCRIGYSEGKGKGVFASREIDAFTLIEVSPVLLFTASEYENHGRHTVLDSYTFKWRDGRMALALGLGSLFNHSEHPNVSYMIDSETESIRYITTRKVHPDQELCIFYGHKLWFEAVDSVPPSRVASDEAEDGWGGLSVLEDEIGPIEQDEERWREGRQDDTVSEDNLPFVRIRITPDDLEEEEITAVQTEAAWVVDIPDLRQTTMMLKWLKQSDLEAPSLAHLKRVRKINDSVTILLTFTRNSPDPPSVPDGMPEPYIIDVPRTAALTQTSLKLKSTFWPTVFAPRRKGEAEEWTRGRVRWALEAMKTVVSEAQRAGDRGEMPIAAYVPIPYEEESQAATQLAEPLTAHDTRKSATHPLRHAVLNVIRSVADARAAPTTQNASDGPDSQIPGAAVPAAVDALASQSAAAQNGAHYLLTSLTLFTTHEPCIMCSMALLHSRVKEIFYLVPMGGTGGCGGVVCVPKLEGVNHRFGINRWKTGLAWAEHCSVEISADVDA